MKKIIGMLLILLCFLHTAFAETFLYSFNYDSASAGNVETLDLSSYGLMFFMPEGFKEKKVTNNNNALLYYERETPWHSIEFLTCTYDSLDASRKEYADVTPVDVVVNGMNGIMFPFIANLNNGTKFYAGDVFLEIPGYGILNYYEESDTLENLACYLYNVLPASAQTVDTATTVTEAIETVSAAVPETTPEPESTTAVVANVSKPETSEARSIRTHQDGVVNVRELPDPKSARVGVAASNSLFPLLSISENGWYQIQLRDGTVGYISPNLAHIVQ